MKATSALPDEFDKTRLFLIEVPEMKTPQLPQIVSPHDAVEIPVPINDHAFYDLLQFVVLAKEDDISVRLPLLKGNTDAPN
jgi:hypothetical protein